MVCNNTTIKQKKKKNSLRSMCQISVINWQRESNCNEDGENSSNSEHVEIHASL